MLVTLRGLRIKELILAPCRVNASSVFLLGLQNYINLAGDVLAESHRLPNASEASLTFRTNLH